MTNSEANRTLQMLLVEDEELVREMLSEMLSGQGFAVTTAASAQEALQFAQDQRPDLVLSDANMPGMDGVELLTRFRATPELRAVPFFLMSANPGEEERALTAGADRFFHKPITNGAEFASTLRSAHQLATLGDSLQRAVLEALPHGVVVTDVRGRTTWANPAFLALSGYELSELAGRKPGDVLQGPGTDAVTVTRIRKALAARRPCTEGLLNYAKGGRPYFASLDIRPLVLDGVHLGFFALVRSSRSPTTTALARPTPARADAGVGTLHRHLGDAVTSLTEAASDGSVPRELQGALVTVLAEVARLQGITEWVHDGLADLSSDSHPPLPPGPI